MTLTLIITALEKNGKLQKAEDLLKLREDPDIMEYILDELVILVVGKPTFKRKVATENVEKFVTVSDEAFAVLAYENMYDTAKSIGHNMKTNPGMSLSEASDGAYPTKWTSNRRGAKRNQGWDNKGIERYNQLYKKVKEDRSLRGEPFSTNYKNKKRQEMEDKYGRKRKREEARRLRQADRTQAKPEDEDWDVPDENDKAEENIPTSSGVPEEVSVAGAQSTTSGSSISNNDAY